ncbi:MAG: SIS domain-containing protein [Propioniciclava sp.]
MSDFEDWRLDDPAALAGGDTFLRPVAEAGARLRREWNLASDAVESLRGEPRPRAVIAVGPEARLLRALLEPVCPVPFVAWPSAGLPGWVGPLDLVIVLGGTGQQAAAGLHEALRRGSRILVVAPRGSRLARDSAARATTLVPTTLLTDPFPGAVAALAALHLMGLGPAVDPLAVAASMDAAAQACGQGRDLTLNPAKTLALELAEAQPLVWGGSILAARASRRIAEAVREASGRVSLAADAAELLPLIVDAPRRDPFADPVEGESPVRPTLVLVDDGTDDPEAITERDRLRTAAEAHDLRVSTLVADTGDELTRYATLLIRGLFAAAYLRIGLGRGVTEDR